MGTWSTEVFANCKGELYKAIRSVDAKFDSKVDASFEKLLVYRLEFE